MPIWQLCVLLENSNGLGLQNDQIDTSIVWILIILCVQSIVNAIYLCIKTNENYDRTSNNDSYFC